MVKKRRMFDIEMPEDGAPAPEEGPKRRSPMASAIGETLDTVRARQEIEDQIRAENEALAHEHVRLKRLGLVIELLPVGKIAAGKLVRDRRPGADPELDELKASIADVGLSNPIRVEAVGDGYELIQGFRRLSAFRALYEETGKPAFAEIPAVVMPEGESLEDLYRRMVDENLVRKDISFAEMARLAVDYAAEPMTDVDDPKKAVNVLYKSASYQKRSYIRAFLPMVQMLGDALTTPEDVPRALGLAVATKLEAAPELAASVRSALGQGEDAVTVLKRFADEPLPDPEAAPETAPDKPSQAKTSFQFRRREGQARCIAVKGRLEVRLDKDFSTINHRRLEAAIQLMLDQLG